MPPLAAGQRGQPTVKVAADGLPNSSAPALGPAAKVPAPASARPKSAKPAKAAKPSSLSFAAKLKAVFSGGKAKSPPAAKGRPP